MIDHSIEEDTVDLDDQNTENYPPLDIPTSPSPRRSGKPHKSPNSGCIILHDIL